MFCFVKSLGGFQVTGSVAGKMLAAPPGGTRVTGNSPVTLHCLKLSESKLLCRGWGRRNYIQINLPPPFLTKSNMWNNASHWKTRNMQMQKKKKHLKCHNFFVVRRKQEYHHDRKRHCTMLIVWVKKNHTKLVRALQGSEDEKIIIWVYFLKPVKKPTSSWVGYFFSAKKENSKNPQKRTLFKNRIPCPQLYPPPQSCSHRGAGGNNSLS